MKALPDPPPNLKAQTQASVRQIVAADNGSFEDRAPRVSVGGFRVKGLGFRVQGLGLRV